MSDEQTCSVEGCSKHVHARGWCQMHYRRWKTHDTTSVVTSSHNAEETFLARVQRQNECLIYLSVQKEARYIQMAYRGKRVQVHRYAWERVNGPIPAGMYIDHICHNTRCVNTEHLRLATPQQNSAHRSGIPRETITGIRNVRKHRDGWQVQVKKGGVVHYFGKFYDLEDASEAAEQARKRLFGEFAGGG